MPLSVNSRQILVRASIVIGLLLAYYWIYPIIASYFPRSYNVDSRTLVVSAKYFPLTMDGIDSVYVSNGILVARGYDVTFFKLYISRARRTARR